jgi:hypothetical protein
MRVCVTRLPACVCVFVCVRVRADVYVRVRDARPTLVVSKSAEADARSGLWPQVPYDGLHCDVLYCTVLHCFHAY